MGQLYVETDKCHRRYGKTWLLAVTVDSGLPSNSGAVVRQGPDKLMFNSVTALHGKEIPVGFMQKILLT